MMTIARNATPADTALSPLGVIDLAGPCSQIVHGKAYALVTADPAMRIALFAQCLASAVAAGRPAVLVSKADPRERLQQAALVGTDLSQAARDGTLTALRLRSTAGKTLARDGGLRLSAELDQMELAPESVVVFDDAERLFDWTDTETGLAVAQALGRWVARHRHAALVLFCAQRLSRGRYERLKPALALLGGFGKLVEHQGRLILATRGWSTPQGPAPVTTMPLRWMGTRLAFDTSRPQDEVASAVMARRNAVDVTPQMMTASAVAAAESAEGKGSEATTTATVTTVTTAQQPVSSAAAHIEAARVEPTPASAPADHGTDAPHTAEPAIDTSADAIHAAEAPTADTDPSLPDHANASDPISIPALTDPLPEGLTAALTEPPSEAATDHEAEPASMAPLPEKLADRMAELAAQVKASLAAMDLRHGVTVTPSAAPEPAAPAVQQLPAQAAAEPAASADVVEPASQPAAEDQHLAQAPSQPAPPPTAQVLQLAPVVAHTTAPTRMRGNVQDPSAPPGASSRGALRPALHPTSRPSVRPNELYRPSFFLAVSCAGDDLGLTTPWQQTSTITEAIVATPPEAQGVMLLPFEGGVTLRGIADAIHAIRMRAPGVHVVIRERSRNLRLTGETALVKVGASLILHRDLPPRSVLSLLQAVAAHPARPAGLTHPVDQTLAYFQVPKSSGCLPGEAFRAQAMDLINRAQGTQLPCTLVELTPSATALASDPATLMLHACRDDLLGADAQTWWVLLQGCRSQDAQTVVRRAFGPRFDALFDGTRLYANPENIRQALKHRDLPEAASA